MASIPVAEIFIYPLRGAHDTIDDGYPRGAALELERF